MKEMKKEVERKMREERESEVGACVKMKLGFLFNEVDFG